MNKINVEDIKDEEKEIIISEDTIIFIKNSNLKIKYDIKNEVNIFECIIESSLDRELQTENNLKLNIFSVNSSIKEKINMKKSYTNLNYAYSTINNKNNKYEIDINHLENNITSKITNHGVCLKNNLNFTINTIVPNESFRIKTSQDSKIILLNDGVATIKPSLLVANDDIEANHSAYVGEFKSDDIFYLKTRGLNQNDAEKLLVKSFLLGSMDISFKERNIILEILKKYWR